MSYSFSRVGGAFVVNSTAGLVYSGNDTIQFKNLGDSIQVLVNRLAGGGLTSSIGAFRLADITTIGGIAVAETVVAAIAQLNQLIGNNQGLTASDGTLLQVDDLAQTFNYNVDGTLNYIQVTSGGSNYRQTYGYTSGRITSISNWVKQ